MNSLHGVPERRLTAACACVPCLCSLAWPRPSAGAAFAESDMAKKLYVCNLGYGVTDADLLKLFEPFGEVRSAQVIMDRDTGRSKGFAFVEMGSDAAAQAAIQGLNGKEVDGRALTVNEARPKESGGG